MQTAEAVERYLEFVRERHALKTFKTYSERLRGFVREFGAAPLTSLDPEQVEAFVARRDGRAPDTVRVTICAFEQFQRWAVERGHLHAPLCRRIRKPRGRLRQRIPTDDEQRAILEHASDEFRRMFTALRLTGARPAELCGADIADWDEAASLIVLRTHKTFVRTSQDRRIGVGYRLRELLRVATYGRSHGPLLLDEQGRRWRVGQLSSRYRRLRNRAGLSRDLVLYAATRHEHGTRLTRRLGIRAAAHSLGHSSIVTTMRYDHPDDRELPRYQDQAYDF